jgi:hypothetical protein
VVGDVEALLARAEAHIFAPPPLDAAGHLCLANMRYGLAKLHCLQEALGWPADAAFIATPDMTITRNANRWASGFGYGGKIIWGDGTRELIPLEVKPNCCGMLVGALEQLPDPRELLENLHRLERDQVLLDGIPVEWDFQKSNHFIDLYRVVPNSDLELPPYAFIVHGSGSELRGENPRGDGLYWDHSAALRRKAMRVETPFGPVLALVGEEARAYYRYYQEVLDFTLRRRALAARRLFGPYRLIANLCHQGLGHSNEILLGCHAIEGDPDQLYPMVLRADLRAYLLRGRPNLSAETIARLGFEERARELGQYERLRAANLLPHGGGYQLPEVAGVLHSEDRGGVRYFHLRQRGTAGPLIVSGVKELPFQYRGEEVLEQTLALGLGEVVAFLEPVLVLKA